MPGPIAKDKTRTMITVPKELKKQLELIAKEHNRSLNNLINVVLMDFVAKSNSNK